METQTSSLVTMEAATDKESVAAFVEEILAGTGWEIDSVRHRMDRMDPPNGSWSVFAGDIYKDEQPRSLRPDARGALNSPAWPQLTGRPGWQRARHAGYPTNARADPQLPPET